MASYRDWVFETDAPREAFLRELRRALVLQDAAVAEARVHDLRFRGRGGRAYLRATYEERGIRVEAKLKPTPLLGSDETLARTILDAGRQAQVRLLPHPEEGRGGKA